MDVEIKRLYHLFNVNESMVLQAVVDKIIL